MVTFCSQQCQRALTWLWAFTSPQNENKPKVTRVNTSGLICFLVTTLRPPYRSLQPIGASLSALWAIISSILPHASRNRSRSVLVKTVLSVAETESSSCGCFGDWIEARDRMRCCRRCWEDFSTPTKGTALRESKATLTEWKLTSNSAEIGVNKQEEPRRATSWAQALQLPHR